LDRIIGLALQPGLPYPAAIAAQALTKPMILPLFRRSTRADTISALYGAIVAQARMPAFYRDYGVPDTVDGRFELIVLHLVLLMRRFDRDGALRELGQGVFDAFCKDMDHNLREMGVSDLKVPKEMRQIGAAYYGRANAYRGAFAQGIDALAAACARNVLGMPGRAEAGTRLATYIIDAARGLDGQETSALVRGTVQFPAV
jgi:cytochrome b pre-mRNA-processing protein 3